MHSILTRIKHIETNEDKKGYSLDDILIKTWKCLGEVRGIWLTRLFNKLLMTKKMLDESRRNVVVPIYKNKGDIQNCINYRRIKLLNHIMKLWERVIEQRLK